MGEDGDVFRRAGGLNSLQQGQGRIGLPRLDVRQYPGKDAAAGFAAGDRFGPFLVFKAAGAARHGQRGGNIGHHRHDGGLVVLADLFGRVRHGQAIDPVRDGQIAMLGKPIHQLADGHALGGKKPRRFRIVFKYWIGNLRQQLLCLGCFSIAFGREKSGGKVRRQLGSAPGV